MAPVHNSMDCVTENCLTAFSRTMYYEGSGLNMDNYAEYFHNLLYLEEYESTQKLQQYNMKAVSLEFVSDKRLQLKVSVSTSYMSVCGTINMMDVSGGIVTGLDLHMKACLGTMRLTVLVSMPLIYCAFWYLFLVYLHPISIVLGSVISLTGYSVCSCCRVWF
jgi:hypothetical protein